MAVVRAVEEREQGAPRIARQAASSSRLRRVAASSCSASPRSSTMSGADVRHRGFLRVAHVLQQRTGGADRERHARAAEARQVARAELLGQRARAQVGSKCQGGAQPPWAARAHAGHGGAASSGTSSSAGRSRSSSASSAAAPSTSMTLNRPAGQIQPRQSEARPSFAGHRGEQGLAPLTPATPRRSPCRA